MVQGKINSVKALKAQNVDKMTGGTPNCSSS